MKYYNVQFSILQISNSMIDTAGFARDEHKDASVSSSNMPFVLSSFNSK